MKKYNFLRGIMLVVLTLCLIGAVACGKTSYTVTLAYDVTQGSVALSPAETDGKYTEGTEVTVTVTPKSGYEVNTFSVTGAADAALDNDGKYAFTVSADTTVSVTFREVLSPVYAVTLSYDEEKGSVSLLPQAADNKYEEGSEVTVQVVPED